MSAAAQMCIGSLGACVVGLATGERMTTLPGFEPTMADVYLFVGRFDQRVYCVHLAAASCASRVGDQLCLRESVIAVGIGA